MENKRLQKLSAAALIVSILPLTVFVPTLFHITLSDNARSILAGVNIFSVFLGLVLSVICVRNRNSRSVINILSTIISSFWLVLMCGIFILSLFINFMQS